MKNTFNFLSTVERLHYEKRTTLMSNGEAESVSSHSWMMSIMAILLIPKLQKIVNIEKVLKLCATHDLPEAKTTDIPLHEQIKNKDGRELKYSKELAAMESFQKIIGAPVGDDLLVLWQEYEDQKTPEAQFVKVLDKLDVCIQTACSKTLDYMGEYEDSFYWKLYFSDKYRKSFNFDPVLTDLFDVIQDHIRSRLQKNGIDAGIYKND